MTDVHGVTVVEQQDEPAASDIDRWQVKANVVARYGEVT